MHRYKLHLLLAILLLTPISIFAAESSESLTEGMVNPGYHDKPGWFKESFLDIREDIAEASEQGRRVILYFYQDGCPYCSKILRDNFGDSDIAAYSKKHFDVIAINMWGDKEVTDLAGKSTTEKTFSKELSVQFTPTLLFLDEAGKVLIRINGYFAPHKFQIAMQYVAEKKENVISIRDYFKTIKPEKASGKLHTAVNTLKGPVYDFQKSLSDKYLVVMFEQKVCKACDELHMDILNRKELKASIAPFEIAVIDSWSTAEITTPSGERTTVTEWSKNLGIQYTPSMLFFDQQGKEVFRTEGYLRTFHVKAAFDYVSSGSYKTIPEFQRFVQKIADDLHAQGIEFDLMD